MNALPLVLLSLVYAADPPAGEDRYAGNACVNCHREQAGRLNQIVLNWSESIHHENDVACQDCHGGDAALTRDQFTSDKEFEKAAHASFNPEFQFLRNRGSAGVDRAPKGAASYACRECHVWSTESQIGSPHGENEASTCLFTRFGGVSMSRERGVAYICAKCHSETTEKQLGSPHGNRGAPSCLFCHGNGSHAIKPATVDIIDPRPREEQGRCSLCHQPDTMNAVAHVRKTLEEADQRITVSNRQFEELDRLGYRNLGLGEMNAHVAKTRASLRQTQHGCNLREINELAKSIENVAKRTAYDYDLVRALNEARQRQTKIAIGVAALLLLLANMLLLYKRAFCLRDGEWSTRVPARRDMMPPCNDACPAGNNIQGFIAAAAKEEYDEALEILLETTPLPGVCGRVCPAPCMTACNRRLHDESTNIRELERYVADHGRWKSAARATRDQRIAVVGSGPAGLSATHHLVRLGYRVTLIERDEELGGVLRYGIPAYRLPHDVLDRDIGRILEHDVTVRTGEHVTREDLSRLSHEFDGVFVATGLQRPRSIDLHDATPDAVLQGVRFLEQARKSQANVEGKGIVVIGGGNVAIDVARTALRLSCASVGVFCLEKRGEMPALVEEVEEAADEGIEIHNGWGPGTLRRGSGHAAEIEFRRCVSVFDERGRFAPTFDDNERKSVGADTVILAVGQAADLSILPEGAEAREGHALFNLTGASIFVGGDLAAGAGTVTAAIGSGRRAALHIHRSITGEDLSADAPRLIATPDQIKMQEFAHAPRQRGLVLPPDVRRSGFAEVYAGLQDNGEVRPATVEAQRCFSCGVCNQCDRCVTYCPEGIVVRNGSGHLVDFDYCKGCGVCAAECPRGVIRMTDW